MYKYTDMNWATKVAPKLNTVFSSTVFFSKGFMPIHHNAKTSFKNKKKKGLCVILQRPLKCKRLELFAVGFDDLLVPEEGIFSSS